MSYQVAPAKSIGGNVQREMITYGRQTVHRLHLQLIANLVESAVHIALEENYLQQIVWICFFLRLPNNGIQPRMEIYGQMSFLQEMISWLGGSAKLLTTMFGKPVFTAELTEQDAPHATVNRYHRRILLPLSTLI